MGGAGRGAPDEVAVVIGDARIRWGDFDDAAERAAAALNAHGIGLHDRVAQLLYNCPEYLDTTYASFKLRAATVNVNYRYKAPEIVHVLGDAGAKALVFHGAFAEVVDEAREALPELELLVQVDGGDGVPLLPGAISYEELLDGFQPMPPIERAGTDTQLLYTGGTTGLPKAWCGPTPDCSARWRSPAMGRSACRCPPPQTKWAEWRPSCRRRAAAL